MVPRRSQPTRMDDDEENYPDPERQLHPKKKKKKEKKIISSNYRPIKCLSMIWKIVSAQIREEIYYSLEFCGLFLEEQK